MGYLSLPTAASALDWEVAHPGRSSAGPPAPRVRRRDPSGLLHAHFDARPPPPVVVRGAVPVAGPLPGAMFACWGTGKRTYQSAPSRSLSPTSHERYRSGTG